MFFVVGCLLCPFRRSQVDCVAERDLCSTQKLMAFPTIRFFKVRYRVAVEHLKVRRALCRASLSSYFRCAVLLLGHKCCLEQEHDVFQKQPEFAACDDGALRPTRRF